MIHNETLKKSTKNETTKNPQKWDSKNLKKCFTKMTHKNDPQNETHKNPQKTVSKKETHKKS